MRVQLWSHSYAPEPTGIGPVNAVLAQGLRERGHQVEVVAAHPHYPEPLWGRRRLPYVEQRDGIRVVRLPLWVGKASTLERYRQELTFMASLAAAAPFVGRPDVLVSTSPAFLALLPAMGAVRARRLPWVLWLHDLLPDGAAATGLVDEGSAAVRLARVLERAAYRTANSIVVLSRSFTTNLLSKSVPESKIHLVYDPATRIPRTMADPASHHGPLRLLSMGNIGYSQGFTPLIRAFEGAAELTDQAVVRVTGIGVAADDARAEIVDDRVRMLGLVDDEQLEQELSQADIGLVTQRYEGTEFNIPSKLMNFMAYGLPILAAADPNGEVARIVHESGGGWVVDSRHSENFPREVARLAENRGEIRARGERARAYAAEHFTPAGFSERFEQVLRAARR